MAPVGSYESLLAAINAGANSVYFGISKLNMRSRSSANFGVEDLKKIAETCHHKNVKAYITLNTVIYDDDIELMNEIVDAAVSSNIDAIIGTDQSVLFYCNEKGIPVHASTQLSISNIQSVRFYSKFCDVMVLARELNLDQISLITKTIKEENICGPSGKLVRIEVFAHGALCMAVSGKCFISEHQHDASANRGACYQSCRREYTVFDDRGEELKLENNFILSPKDLNTISFLDKIIEAGVRVLKIEGRGRSPEYVKTIVETYKKALTLIDENTYSPEEIEKLNKKLMTVFNRGFYEGHYLGKHSNDWNSTVYGSKASTKKVYVGKGVKYFKNISVGEFQMESDSLKIGDTILIIGPTTGVVEQLVTELRFNDNKVTEVSKGDRFSMPTENIIRNSDKLYKVIQVSR